MPVINPATENVLANAPRANLTQLNDAVAAIDCDISTAACANGFSLFLGEEPSELILTRSERVRQRNQQIATRSQGACRPLCKTGLCSRPLQICASTKLQSLAPEHVLTGGAAVASLVQ
jgi:hypothetical protein